MPTSMTFTTLKDDMRRYLERGAANVDADVFIQIPRLVNAAERKLMQTLKLLGTLEVLNDPTGLAQGVSVIPKPDRWRQTVSIWFGKGAGNNERTPLFPRSYEYLRQMWPDDSVQAEPQFYADYGYGYYLIAPTPDAEYPLELNAYLQPALLDDANQSNFWTAYTPSALLYCALLEASPFLKDDSRIAVWQQYFEFELATLNSQDLQKILDRSAKRERP